MEDQIIDQLIDLENLNRPLTDKELIWLCGVFNFVKASLSKGCRASKMAAFFIERIIYDILTSQRKIKKDFDLNFICI